jgi:hypothetical protein
MLPDLAAAPPVGPPSTSFSNSVVDAVGPINIIFKLGGGRCQTHQQRPLGGPPLTSSSNSVVDAAGPAGSTPQEARHRHHQQPQWWTLPDQPTAPPGGRHRHHLQLRWWMLPDPLAAPPGGPPSTASSNSVVDAARPTGSTLRGPTINVISNLGGGRYRTH